MPVCCETAGAAACDWCNVPVGDCCTVFHTVVRENGLLTGCDNPAWVASCGWFVAVAPKPPIVGDCMVGIRIASPIGCCVGKAPKPGRIGCMVGWAGSHAAAGGTFIAAGCGNGSGATCCSP
jgi:hypothetical protein